MTGRSSEEREVKFDARPDQQLPCFEREAVLVVRRDAESLVTAYFDTPDHRLWELGITLRYRSGDDTGLPWTMKSPLLGRDGASLDRIERSWPGGPDAVPEDAATLLRGVVRRAPLGQVVELETTRHPTALYDGAGGLCGELDDDEVTVHGGPNDGLRFRQIEFEFGPGDRRMSKRVLRALTASGLTVNNETKVGRALGLVPPETLVPTPKTPLGDVVRMTVADGFRQLVEHDQQLRRDPAASIEQIHATRIVVRRLRSALKTFHPVLDPLWAVHLRAELQWFGEHLGQVRDVDVLSGEIGVPAAEIPLDIEGRAELLRHLDEERTDAVAALAVAMESARYLDLLDRLHVAGRLVPFRASAITARRPGNIGTQAAAALPPLLLAQWKSLSKRVDHRGKRPTDEQLHGIRKAAKRLRYASEGATPVVGKAARRTARSAKAVQSILGDQHDAVMATRWLVDRARVSTPAGAFAAGRLLEARQADRGRLGQDWVPVWEALNKASRTRWMS